ncbi:hypothetical protein OG873_27755 [Streptomyces violaceus]|uniref:PASTA domain-containing protein n=1 Tax=Streptomyces violaceus TaxID=1936 RepID=A0ABZ1NYF7_STRVL
MMRVRGAAWVALVAALAVLATACGGSGDPDKSDSARKAAPAPGKAKPVPGRADLMAFMKETADTGKGFALKDATALGRYIYPAAAKGYVVCFEKEVPDLAAVDLYAVPDKENCPARPGGKAPALRVPDLNGKQVEESLVEALVTGYNPKRVKVAEAGDPGRVIEPKPAAKWRVCAQKPRAGTVFDASDGLRLQAAKKCP